MTEMSSTLQTNKPRQDIIEIVTNDIYIEIKIQQSLTQILILKIDQFQKVHKYYREKNLVGQDSHFASLSDFGQFMLSPENYKWQDDILNLKLFWKIEAVKYYREKQLNIALEEIDLSEREVIEVQNKILKKQLEYYKQRTLITKRESKQKDKKEMKMKEQKHKQAEDIKQMVDGVNKVKTNNKSLNQGRNQRQKYKKIEKMEGQQSSSFDQRQGEHVDQQREAFRQFESDLKNQKRGRPKKDQPIPIIVKDRIQYIKTRLRTGKTLTKKGKKKTVAKEGKDNKDTSKNKKKENQVRKTKKIQKMGKEKKLKQKKQKNEKVLKQEDLSQKSSSSSSQSAGFKHQRSKKYLGENIFLIKYTNGQVYRGELKNNKFHGKGVYFGKKLKFEGQWREGQTFGPGVSYYNDGGVQKGIYRPGFKRFGLGEDKYSNGQSYVGNFHNQKKSGQGTYYFQNGEYYQGEWMDDMQHGNGTQYFKDGSRFEGIWEVDEKNGEGTLITKLGKIKQIYSRGILTSEYVLLDE